MTRGWTIWAATAPADRSASPGVRLIGTAVVRTDDQGRFEIPAIAEGYLTLSCRPRGDAAYRVRDIPQTLIRADRANEITVAVERAFRVEGTVVDRQTGAGIEGVRIAVTIQQTGSRDHCFTDDRGRFGMHVLPGQYQFRLTSLPQSYAMSPNAEYRAINVVQGSSPSTVDPFEVIKAEPPLRGRVVDEKNQPVAGASVHGVWESWVSNSYGVHEAGNKRFEWELPARADFPFGRSQAFRQAGSAGDSRPAPGLGQ